VDPAASMQSIDNPKLESISVEVRDLLKKMIEEL